MHLVGVVTGQVTRDFALYDMLGRRATQLVGDNTKQRQILMAAYTPKVFMTAMASSNYIHTHNIYDAQNQLLKHIMLLVGVVTDHLTRDIALYDMLGRRVTQLVGDNTNQRQLSIGYLSKEFYILSVGGG